MLLTFGLIILESHCIHWWIWLFQMYKRPFFPPIISIIQSLQKEWGHSGALTYGLMSAPLMVQLIFKIIKSS